MKKIVCEMCGGNDIIKLDGFFVCQSCGVKYSAEEAKKIMIEGKVDVTGSYIKIDDSAEITNLYNLARRAKNEADFVGAENFYSQLLLKRSDDWEANFYAKFFKCINADLTYIADSALKLCNCLPHVFQLIDKAMIESKDKNKGILQVVDACCWFCDNKYMRIFELYNTEKGTQTTLFGLDINVDRDVIRICHVRCSNVLSVLYQLGDLLEQRKNIYPDALKIAVKIWDKANEMSEMRNKILYVSNLQEDERKRRYELKLQKNDIKYVFKKIKSFFD